jgi:hypothetical protein
MPWRSSAPPPLNVVVAGRASALPLPDLGACPRWRTNRFRPPRGRCRRRLSEPGRSRGRPSLACGEILARHRGQDLIRLGWPVHVDVAIVEDRSETLLVQRPGEIGKLLADNVDLIAWFEFPGGRLGVVVIQKPPRPGRPAPAGILDVAVIHARKDTSDGADQRRWRGTRR